MTPLEAAQRLVDKPPMTERRCYECAACGGCFEEHCLDPHGHAVDCPILALPRIVAALEAAEQLVQEDAHTNDYEVPYQGQMACNSCGAITRSHAWTDKEGRAFPEPHTPECPWMALKAALHPDVVPSERSVATHLTGPPD